jgi:uncharacterized protein YyaL (SSP411 family)
VNRLAAEPSPYLRQHASNPVDWFPWCEEAFELAAARDCPVFLSIGYASCHWCHVMERESFEDEQLAQYLNAHFVPVKVDREERPDVDAIYMDATQALTGQGGWPMSVFLTPDGKPFFAGTYFPRVDRHGMPSFRRVLEAVAAAWESRREEVEEQAAALSDTLRDAHEPVPRPPGALEEAAASLPEEAWLLLESAIRELSRRFDEDHGGFGTAPKFPNPGLVELCLLHHWISGSDQSLRMATSTLGAMREGGIYDHLGGGFARYSTDATWTVPHFEKMLYDQAGLVRCYLHAWQATGERRWLSVVEETVGYVLRDLSLAGGGLASSEDADSEGVEGLFYTFSKDELERALPRRLVDVACSHFGLDGEPNFEKDRFVLRLRPGSVTEDAEEEATGRTKESIEEVRRLLEVARAKRVRPARDDKLITEWNAMFCSALAEAAFATNNREWTNRAVEIADALLSSMRRPSDGRWLRSMREGTTRGLAGAADHAWLVDAFTRLAELTGDPRFLEEALDVARWLLGLFFRPGAVLAMTGSDSEDLVLRPADYQDSATPSGTSVAALSLLRLGAFAGDGELTEKAWGLAQAALASAREHPLAVAGAVHAGALVGQMVEVAVPGGTGDLVAALRRRYRPTLVCCQGPPGSMPLLSGREAGKAYVCEGAACLLPTSSPVEITASLDELDDSLRRRFRARARSGR